MFHKKPVTTLLCGLVEMGCLVIQRNLAKCPGDCYLYDTKRGGTRDGNYLLPGPGTETIIKWRSEDCGEVSGSKGKEDLEPSTLALTNTRGPGPAEPPSAETPKSHRFDLEYSLKSIYLVSQRREKGLSIEPMRALHGLQVGRTIWRRGKS